MIDCQKSMHLPLICQSPYRVGSAGRNSDCIVLGTIFLPEDAASFFVLLEVAAGLGNGEDLFMVLRFDTIVHSKFTILLQS